MSVPTLRAYKAPIMNRAWVVAKWLMGYASGVVATMFLMFIGMHLFPLAYDNPVEMAYRWGIDEPEPDRLVVYPAEGQDFRVVVTRDCTTDPFSSEVHIRTEEGLEFHYLTGSGDRPPSAEYVCRRGDVTLKWADTDGDGSFERQPDSSRGGEN